MSRKAEMNNIVIESIGKNKRKEQDIKSIIGQKILEARQKKNITQKELADRFGCYVSNIRKWENGESMPNVAVFFRVALFLNMNTDDILTLMSNEVRKG